MARGKLRLYLGAAPGVGKTYAMLNEGWRRKERGTDVVIGWVQDHGRPQTDAQIRDLEVFPRRTVEYRGQTFEEMDLDGLLARQPELVLVDELAHTNVPGSRNAKRWQDVEELLDAGINVISTVNLQHLESLNDVVEQITGVTQQETVPDPVVAVRRPDRAGRHGSRGTAAAHGPRQRLSARAHRRRSGQLLPHRQPHRPPGAGPAVGGRPGGRGAQRLPGAPRHRRPLGDQGAGGGLADRRRRGSAVLIRRAARMAMRTKAELVGVHVRTDDGLTGAGSQGLVQNRALLDELGGRYVEVVGADVAPALVQVARAENATQLVMGATHRSRLTEFVRGSVINSVIRAAGGSLDVHVIATESRARSRDSGPDAPASRRRRADGRTPRAGPAHATGRRLLSPLSVRRRVGRAADRRRRLPAAHPGAHGQPGRRQPGHRPQLLPGAGGGGGGHRRGVAGGPGRGGRVPPLQLLLRPAHPHASPSPTTRDILALVMFLVTAGVVSVLVDLSARTTAAAVQARADAQMLARVAGRMVAPEGNPLPALLEELMVAFRLDAAAVLRSGTDRRRAGSAPRLGTSARTWTSVAAAGRQPRPPRMRPPWSCR